jgi:hypothetical protein
MEEEKKPIEEKDVIGGRNFLVFMVGQKTMLM